MGNEIIDGNSMDTRRIMFVESMEDEIIAIIEKHGGFNSAHEGYGVLMEEVREFEVEVFAKEKNRCGQRMYEELIQIAAVAAKLAITIAENMPIHETEVSHGS